MEEYAKARYAMLQGNRKRAAGDATKVGSAWTPGFSVDSSPAGVEALRRSCSRSPNPPAVVRALLNLDARLSLE